MYCFRLRMTFVTIHYSNSDLLLIFLSCKLFQYTKTMPKIPMHILLSIWDFFSGLSEHNELEALVHILFDTRDKAYTVCVPRQQITHASVSSQMDEAYPEYMMISQCVCS